MPITQAGRLLELSTPLAADFLLIKRLRAQEGLSQLFRYELEILHEETAHGNIPTPVDPASVLGQSMTVSVRQRDTTERHFNGICVDFTQGNRNNQYSKYRAELVPRAWLLTQRRQSRIFQQKTVIDILKAVFADLSVTYETQGRFLPRNYCVQYRETDWDFASRLMEEEGIYYYFEHTANSHNMILADSPQSHRDCPSKPRIPFIHNVSSNEASFVGAVYTWRVDSRVRTGQYTLWDSNFELPGKHLEANQVSRFSIGGNNALEFYDYPGDYAKRFDGVDPGGGERSGDLQKIFDDNRRTVEIRQQELDVAYKNIFGSSDCCAMKAGHKFELFEHPTNSSNGNHVLVSVHTEAVQSPTYRADGEGEMVANSYTVNFSCIPHGGTKNAPFRPLRQTSKPVLNGSQTAFVVGPPGQEIFTDKYGRVKVQFQWDRHGKVDSNSSCWMRVAQSWASKKWGTMFIPRIGMEVIISFLEGDPDQPIIIGCVYNA